LVHVSVDSVPGAFKLPLWDCVNLGFFPSSVLQPGSPGSQGGGAANAETAVIDSAAAINAATVSIKMMRFISHLLLFYTPPTPMKPKLRWIGCVFVGAGRVVSASTKLQTSVRPFAFEGALSIANLYSYPLPPRFFSQEQNRPPLGSLIDPLVAGCTTGSACPYRCPHGRTGVLASTRLACFTP
jgi:hypothetical protein